ncbi:uncharacterized protein LOC136091205 isoform X1 [Hydra vulgaris]|uniref:Uncharacterized protein LOC136091205 isoform X1 n=1 Tax=Hydra vulgaris TaxID=6087 RepID=A0ABM4DIK5_HYDVU
MEAESLVVQPSYEKLLCDLKLKFTCRKFVPETTFNEILSDLCMIKDFNEIMGPSVVTCSVKSKYEFLLKNEFSYIIPEKVFLSNSEKHYIYVPIKENLKQYLSSANMIEQLELSAIKNANSITNPPKIRDDFVHGKLLKQNKFFAIHPESIGIILYSDDFGSNSNPLWQQIQTKHKTFCLYFCIINLQKKYRSQLKHHNLVLISSARHITEFGLPAIPKVFINDLNDLQSNGLYIQNKHYPVCFVSFLGGNLGSHLIGGFTYGFNSSRPCRYCMITKPKLKKLFASKDCILRTVSNHNAIVEKVQKDASLSTAYGVVCCSPLHCLKNFHPVLSLPPDIMHDLLEGCCPKEMKLILNYVVESKFITWKQINTLMNTFQFKGADKTNKPGPVVKKEIKGKAVQIWCFMRLFGVLFADYFHKSDPVWSTWKLLRQLVDISFAPSFDIEQLPKFKEICEDTWYQ